MIMIIRGQPPKKKIRIENLFYFVLSHNFSGFDRLSLSSFFYYSSLLSLDEKNVDTA